MKLSYFKTAIIISLLFNADLFAQQNDSLIKRENFHDLNAYIDFQFPKGDDPLITSQMWAYVKRSYFEIRYNYEDRRTFSAFYGRSFKIGSDSQLELIPMLGGSMGRFNGISPASTTILEAEWIRGFSQNQYSINTEKSGSNFFFDWTAVVIQVYKPIYFGGSLQCLTPDYAEPQIYWGPMISVKTSKIIIEGFAYNFWESEQISAIGMQVGF